MGGLSGAPAPTGTRKWSTGLPSVDQSNDCSACLKRGFARRGPQFDDAVRCDGFKASDVRDAGETPEWPVTTATGTAIPWT